MKLKQFVTILLLVAALGIQACSDDDTPPIENVEEEITQVILTFTNTQDAGDVVTAEWLDADGAGGGTPVIDDIVLSANMNYELSVEFYNTLESPAENISEEVAEEAEEHMIFYEFSDAVFQDPDGNGNIDNRDDAVNYNDTDSDGLPLGLSTDWVTSDLNATGSFRLLLKHQPGIKSSTSSSADGETDVDVTFDITVQ
ncbi:MAG: hypothetical protein P8X57_06175 [Cyclobacteriaceae bacterium]